MANTMHVKIYSILDLKRPTVQRKLKVDTGSSIFVHGPLSPPVFIMLGRDVLNTNYTFEEYSIQSSYHTLSAIPVRVNT